MGAPVGLFQAQLEGVAGALKLQQQLADPLAMTFPLGFDTLQSELDAIVNMRSKKATSLLSAGAQHCVNAVLLVSKTVPGFARYPDRRPAGVVPADDGSLDVDHIYTIRTMPSATLDDAFFFCAATARGAHGSSLLDLFVACRDATATVPAEGPNETKTSPATLLPRALALLQERPERPRWTRFLSHQMSTTTMPLLP